MTERFFEERLRREKYSYENLRAAAANAVDPRAEDSGEDMDRCRAAFRDLCAVCDETLGFFASFGCFATAESDFWRRGQDRKKKRKLSLDGRLASHRSNKYKWGPKCCPNCCVCEACIQRVCSYVLMLDVPSDPLQYDDYMDLGGNYDGGDDGGVADVHSPSSPVRQRRQAEEQSATPMSPLRLGRTNARCLQEHVAAYKDALELQALLSSATGPIAYMHDGVMLLPRCKSRDKAIVLAADTFGCNATDLVLLSDPVDFVCVLRLRLAEGELVL